MFVIQNVCPWMKSPGSDVPITKKRWGVEGLADYPAKHNFYLLGPEALVVVVIAIRMLGHISWT